MHGQTAGNWDIAPGETLHFHERLFLLLPLKVHKMIFLETAFFNHSAFKNIENSNGSLLANAIE